MNELESCFKNVIIKYHEMTLFKPKDAIGFIKMCFCLNKSIYGIDAFILRGHGIQPFMEHNLNANKNYTNEEQMKEFVKHLEKYVDSEFVFEIVYDGY